MLFFISLQECSSIFYVLLYCKVLVRSNNGM
jgi:hypothetical protein